jgi:acetyltransferase-like isoleucine patch superfamily enzyme
MVNELLKIFESCIRNIDGALGRRIRGWYYRRRLGRCGSNVVIEAGVFFQGPRHIFISDNVWIDRYAILISGPFTPSGRKFIHKPNTDYKAIPGDLTISKGVHIAPHTLLQAHGGLHIGTNVTVAAGSKIYTLSHHYKNLLDRDDKKRYSFSSMAAPEDQFLILSPVVIRDNAAVGLNAVVLPGTTIQEGTWLGVLAYVQPGATEKEAIYYAAKAVKKN